MLHTEETRHHKGVRFHIFGALYPKKKSHKEMPTAQKNNLQIVKWVLLLPDNLLFYLG